MLKRTLDSPLLKLQFGRYLTLTLARLAEPSNRLEVTNVTLRADHSGPSEHLAFGKSTRQVGQKKKEMLTVSASPRTTLGRPFGALRLIWRGFNIDHQMRIK